MTIRFTCPSCNRNLKARNEHEGRTLPCPVPTCRAPVTVPAAPPQPQPSTTASTLKDELLGLEAVVRELETKIKDGRISVAVLKRQVEKIADPQTIIAKINARDSVWIDTYQKEAIRISGIDKIDIGQLLELKDQHPDDPHVAELVHRAATCCNNLYEILFLATEQMSSGDVKQVIQSNNQEIREGLKLILSLLLMPATPLETNNWTKDTLDTTEKLCRSFSMVKAAIASAQKDVMKALVKDNRIDIYATDKDERTLMHLAAFGGDLVAMKWLRNNTKLAVDTPMKNGDMPIHIAAFGGHKDVVDWLLDLGVYVNIPGARGETPMCKAAMAGKADMMRYLKTKGAAINAMNGGPSPMELAVGSEQLESISCLVKMDGTLRDKPNADGLTPLLQAVGLGMEKSIACLKSLGADIDAPDAKGITPLAFAVLNNQVKSLKYLQHLGADVTPKIGDMTLLDIANEFGATEAADWLRKNVR